VQRTIKLTLFSILFLVTGLHAQVLSGIAWEPENPVEGEDVTVTVNVFFPEGGWERGDHEILRENNNLIINLNYFNRSEMRPQMAYQVRSNHTWEGLEAGRYQIQVQLQCNDLISGENYFDFEAAGFEVAEGDAPDPFVITLEEGWNMISAPVIPERRDVLLVFHELVERGSLLMAKDGQGRFYCPEFNFCNMPRWNIRGGYLVNVNRDEELSIAGEFIPPDMPIPLEEGWNMIAYFPEEELEAPEAFRNIEDVLLIAKDGEGRFYLPERNFNNMEPLSRGSGYMVKVNRETALVWNFEE